MTNVLLNWLGKIIKKLIQNGWNLTKIISILARKIK